MLGLWLENNKISLKTDLPLPLPQNDEVLVEILISGICNTDLELIKGYYPYTGILGHEFVGIVRSHSSPLNNKRVVGEINVACTACDMCKKDIPSHCKNRSVLGIVNKSGSFSEFITLPPRNLFIVPENVSNEEATFTEPLAAALEIQQQIHIKPNDKILVIGDGKLASLIIQTLLIKGEEVWIEGKHPEKMKKLTDKGALRLDHSINHLFDIIIESSGHPSGFDTAMKYIKPRGTIVMKSTYTTSPQINLSKLVVDEITLIGSRCGPFQPALNLLSKKLIDVTMLIDSIYPLKDALQAFDRAMTKGGNKVLIKKND